MDWVDLLAVQGALESATNDTQTRDTQAALCLAHDAGPVGPWLCFKFNTEGDVTLSEVRNPLCLSPFSLL